MGPGFKVQGRPAVGGGALWANFVLHVEGLHRRSGQISSILTEKKADFFNF